jgi:HEPN domain-containing protein
MSGTSDPVDWLNKARQDARSARRLLADPPEIEVAAYHVQQAVEKAIKSYLAAEAIRYPRDGGAGHDLAALASLIPKADPPAYPGAVARLLDAVGDGLPVSRRRPDDGRTSADRISDRA